MITINEYFMGRDKAYPINQELADNAQTLVARINSLLIVYCDDLGLEFPGVRSGYRPLEINSKVIGASKSSKHMTCQACDLSDNNGTLKSWCLKNLDLLAEADLWMESPESTPSWCHLQSVAPGSGHRVFLP